MGAGASRGLRKVERAGLIAAFLLAGILGHDPWRGDETYSFGMVYHFFTTHSWLVPTNAGTPFMEKPPLYYWAASLMCRLLGGVLELHEAARLTSVGFMLITIAFMREAGLTLFARHKARFALTWVGVALLLGEIGLVRYAHELSTDVALLTGSTITMYGLSVLVCAPERWRLGGFWTGVGLGTAMLSKGFFVPAMFVLASLALIAALPALRTRNTLKAMCAAFLALMPFLLWPLMLYLREPGLFMEWFWENNIGRFLGFSVSYLGAENRPGFFLKTVPWFAFPAFPLAVAGVVSGWREHKRQGYYALPLAVAAAGLLLLLISASGRGHYLLPLLPAFALLGAPVLLKIPSLWLLGWNSVVRIFVSAAALVIWCTWRGLLHPHGALGPLAARFGGFLPLHFMPQASQAPEIALALLLLILWIASFRLSSRIPQNTAYIWLAGVALLWGTAFTLLLPWLDDTKTYRHLVHGALEAVGRSDYPQGCIASHDLDESIAPMFEYFSGRLAPVQDYAHASCPLIFAQTRSFTPAPGDGWRLLWKGKRPLDQKDEELRLYEKTPAGFPAGAASGQ